MDEICKASEDDGDGQKDSNMELTISIAKFMHQEYTELYAENEVLKTQVQEMMAQNNTLMPIITELEDQNTVKESKIKDMSLEAVTKDTSIKIL